MDTRYPKIFISYAREDKDKALRLYENLEALGCELWIDIKNLLPGQNWKLTVKKAVGLCDFFVACLSANSVSKVGFFQSEMKEAYEILKQYPEGNIYLIPVRLDECDMPYEISDYHWVNLYESEGMQKLFEALKAEWSKRGFNWPEI